ncbi:MAG: alpha-amylase family glycosyl hydrolase [Bacteroidetes bacterium]|nr:alpha-amylase family glycosyl hydrolase [Bacteroidota bacterium]
MQFNLLIPTYEFHISRKSREMYSFDEVFFSLTGDVIFMNFRAAQQFASRLNAERTKRFDTAQEASRETGKQISPSEINAMGIFHEVLHFVIDSYVAEINPDAFSKLEARLKGEVGERDVDFCLEQFVESFPPNSVYRMEESPAEFLKGASGGLSRRQVVIKEIVLLWLENRNPSFNSISELVDDSPLKASSSYEMIMSNVEAFFETQPGYGPTDAPLIKMLLAPIEAFPDSITEQLQFIARHWGPILAKSPYMRKLLGAIDFIKEEGKYFLMLAQAQAEKSKIPGVVQAGFFGFGEKESAPIPRFAGMEHERENFSADLNWMPNLVLIAKNIFVWLDQLSRKYSREITRLDQIPDEELVNLSQRGFSGLWLIGIWIRSNASKRIKHLNGNIDAIASAYSLDAYEIAPELGGEEGYKNLKERAINFGIRLASDMVPNHMGIDSSWVIEHPDWFLQSKYSPFPNYSFTGPDLSSDDRVGIFIEDGYWSKRDAAVVFKRLDRWTSEARYIYHGNDGTHMPWNDTAQLDFTKPEVREAVIRTILHAARMFPIIRFDAAMVLSKKHYQRLWFPEPGTGGAIPSRSNFSMTREQFDGVMPNEFWREVVDRAQKEAPDTLLLAEAFWLMEGYFVRTLGMHRVYNSAFMNMLKKEENANYRQVMKNVLEYNPQILKRFVNFLNNPDEETAIAQFGKDDKYFGVCAMMATMPGTPMFGHGQVEGFTEKYGMEFKRAYREEVPDEWLVARHEREIFPLLKRRHLFSEMDNFRLYDFSTAGGSVNEDVFAYSNGIGAERVLFVYNNRYSHASGWIRMTVGFRDESGTLARHTLADGLGVKGGKEDYYFFRDVISGLEYIRPASGLKKEGLYIELGAYKYGAFVDFRELHSSQERPWGELCKELNGRGVRSVEDELTNMKLRDIHAALYEAFNAGSLKYLLEGIANVRIKPGRAKAFEEKARKLALAIENYEHVKLDVSSYVKGAVSDYETLLSLNGPAGERQTKEYISRFLSNQDLSTFAGWRIMFVWVFLHGIEKRFHDGHMRAQDLFDNWRVAHQICTCYQELGLDEPVSQYESQIARELLSISEIRDASTDDFETFLKHIINGDSVKDFLGVHMYDGIAWFNKERFEDLLGFVTLVEIVKRSGSGKGGTRSRIRADAAKDAVTAAIKLEKQAAGMNYRLDEFLSV